MAHRSLATLIAILTLAACGGEDEAVETVSPSPPPPATTEGPATTEAAGGTVVRVYYVDSQKTEIDGFLDVTPPTGSVATETMRLLLKNEEQRPTEIPAGVKLLGLNIVDGVAEVDLSRDFETGGGAASMQARVAQVVFTLTQWPTVRSVTFKLDGERVAAIGGEGVPAREVTRGDFSDVVPTILVELPPRGGFGVSPMTVAGSASVYEANVSLRIEDANGKTLAEGFATAEEGAPGRGDFDTQLEFDVDKATDATLVAFESDASDGSENHVVRVPVRLCPPGTVNDC